MRRPSSLSLRRRTGPDLVAALLAGLLGGPMGCGYVPARFADRPAVAAVDDRRPIPRPLPRLQLAPFDLADGYVRQPITSALDPTRPDRARDVNALDEVVVSSWWEPPPDPDRRLAGYPRWGPPQSPIALSTSPVPTKREGAVAFTDARGARWAVLLDPPDRPGLYGTAATVASRLLFALGYRVAETWPVEVGGRSGVALAWPDGSDLGATPPYRGRFDDANDVILRRDRRTLRALPRVLAWIGKSDLDVGDLRDAYVGTSPRGHVLHFVLGLEGALGVDALERHLALLADPDRPAEDAGERLLTLGLGAPTELGPPLTDGPALGIFGDEVDPDDFAPSPPFEPQRHVTPADDGWIGAQLARLPIEVIEEAVSATRLEEGDRRRLVARLETRRRAIAAWALGEVTPLWPSGVAPTPDGGFRLRLVDAAITGGLAESDGTGWSATLFDGEGSPLSERPSVLRHDADAELVVPGAWLRGGPYVVVRLLGQRGTAPAPRPMEVHVALGRGQPPRVVGVVH